MAEYLEPVDFDDLLEGSDEDDAEVEQANNYNELLDLNELEDVGVGTISAVDNPIFLDMLQPLGDSDEEEDEEGRLAKEEKKKADDSARRDKMAKMLNMVAPGIDLFPPPPDEEGNGFSLLLPGQHLRKNYGFRWNLSLKHIMAVLLFCVSRFILLVSEFSAGLPSHLEFRNRNNWSEQIIFMHVLLLLGTDKRFIMDHRVKESITSALHYHMDSFSSSQWFWGPANRPANDQSKQDGFNHSNVHKSWIRMVNEFFPGELCPSVMTWDQGTISNLKVTNLDGTSDHHLNMLHRIHLVPPSFRGNQVRKYLAFMYLQTLAEISFSLPTHVDVVDLVDSPDLCDKLSDGLKMIVLSKNYELIMTLVELYDIIVGHEPEVDFDLDKVEHIKRVKKGVLGWVQKKLPGIGRGVDINNEQSIKAMQLAEYLDIVEGRWQTYYNRHS